MPSVVDSLELIGKTMGEILDFVANDEILSDDFRQYLEYNNIEIETEKQFNNVIIQYMLEEKMQNGLRVLEYFRRNHETQSNIIEALQNSFCAVFKINKILSNAFEVTCLTSNADLEIIPMVKMSHLKQIGKYDFIQARIVELDNVQYILEIYDVISEFDVAKASIYAIKYMIQNPKSAYFKNPEMKVKLEKSVEEFYIKFKEFFNCNYISTTNKQVDDLIAFFNDFRLSGKKSEFEELIKKPEKFEYINLEHYRADDGFINEAIGGFSTHKEIYDTALWIDKKRGLYIIPFLETFFKSFDKDGDSENKKKCIKEFMLSDKVPPSVIKYACENKESFFDKVNEALSTDFSNLEEVLFNTKAAFVDEGVFSPVITLFNSELFSKLIEIENKAENGVENGAQMPDIGRNDPCPCGSGKKYKNCCMNK